MQYDVRLSAKSLIDHILAVCTGNVCTHCPLKSKDTWRRFVVVPTRNVAKRSRPMQCRIDTAGFDELALFNAVPQCMVES